MRLLIAVCALLAGQAVAQEVYKCGNTYTDKPCAEGKVIDTAPAVAEAGMTTIYRCQPPEHFQAFWIAKPCAETIDTLKQIDSASVPANMDLNQQVDYVYRQRAKQKSGSR